MLCIVEWLGPSRVIGWSDLGPVGGPHAKPLVIVLAVTVEQTKNTMDLIPDLITDQLRAAYGLPKKLPKEMLYGTLPSGNIATLQALTSNPRPFEGKRVTFVLCNEVQHWIATNDGHEMFRQVRNNTTKGANRFLCITNAYLPGEDSVGQVIREAYDKAKADKGPDAGWLYDSVEAHPKAPLDYKFLPRILERIRGDAVWLPIPEVVEEILDPLSSPSDMRRMWLNQIVADEDALYSPQVWQGLVSDKGLKPGDSIALGFDGGKSDDATALIAIRLDDGHVEPIGVWEKPDGPRGDGWQVNREVVDTAVRDTFRQYDVQVFYADVALWESYIDAWSRDYGEGLAKRASASSAIGWDMRQSAERITKAHERLMAAVFDKSISHNADPTLQRHALNARRRVNQYGITFGKESRESPRKVDAYAALLLAFEARRDYYERGKRQEVVSREGFFY